MFNSLFDPCEIGTQRALELMQMQTTKTREMMNANCPYDEKPVFSLVSSDTWTLESFKKIYE